MISDEENNEENIAQEIANTGKKIGNTIKNGKKVVNAIKNWKKYKIILIIAAAIIAAIVTAAVVYYIFGWVIDVYTAVDDFLSGKTNNSSSLVLANDKESYHAKAEKFSSQKLLGNLIEFSKDKKNYIINYEYLEKKNEKVESGAISVSKLKLKEDNQDIKESLIAKYVEANIKTMYPKIGSSEVDGKIKIQRDTNSGMKELLYKPYDELKKMIDNKNLDSLNYFSIKMDNSEEPLLCYAVSDITIYYDNNDNQTGMDINSLTLQEEKYMHMIEPYSMSYEFLILLHVYSQEKEFMESVINLLEDYSATITLKDTVSTTITTTKYSGTWYQVIKKELNYTKRIGQEDVVAASDVSTGKYTYEGPKTKIVENKDSKEINNNNIIEYYSEAEPNKIKAINDVTFTEKELTYINSWIAKTENTYVKGKTSESLVSDNTEVINTPSGETDIKYDGKSYIEISNTKKSSPSITSLGEELIKFVNGLENEKTKVILNSLKTFIYERKEINKNVKVTNQSTEYTNQNKDTKYNLENENGFIDLLNKNTKAKGNLISIDKWIFNKLNENENTQAMEQVMRYIFFKITNKDYGVTNINDLTNIFDINDFQSASTSGDTLKIAGDFISYFEGTGEVVTKDGKKYYKAYWDSYGKVVTIGRGVTTYKIAYFKKYAIININVGDLIEVEIVDAIKEEIISDELKSLQNKYPGLQSYQYVALLSAKYQCPSLVNGFKSNYATYWKESDNKYKEKIPNADNYLKQLKGSAGDSTCENINDSLKNLVKCEMFSNGWANYCHSGGKALPGLVKRRYYEWILFQYGYNLITNEYISINTDSGTGEVVELALSYVGKNYREIWGKSADMHWCAKFVSYCFDRCGLIPSALPKSYTSCGNMVTWLRKQGTFIERKSGYVPKAGDVFFLQGTSTVSRHTGIVEYCDGEYIYTIEGNLSGSGNGASFYSTSKVKKLKRKMNSDILGFFPASKYF